MINKIQIQNFQSHRNSELELSPGVNIIVGSSDSGKTAILRALKWVIWNRPGGDSFRSTWGGDTTVLVETGNHKVERGKRKATKENKLDNYYFVNKTLFKAFGTDVPKEVHAALNISEINLQQQLDGPFLINQSPGEVAKHFNKIAKLDQIDTGLKNVQSAIRNLEQKRKYDKERLTTLMAVKKEYDYLGECEIAVEALERKLRVKGIAINSRTTLENSITTIEKIDDKIEHTKELIKPEKEVNQLLATIKAYNGKLETRKGLEKLFDELQDLETEIENAKEIQQSEHMVLYVSGLIEKRNAKSKTREGLDSWAKSIGMLDSKMGIQEYEIHTAEKEFKDNFPDECPLCGNTLIK